MHWNCVYLKSVLWILDYICTKSRKTSDIIWQTWEYISCTYSSTHGMDINDLTTLLVICYSYLYFYEYV
jgi:hypothetical protein